MSMLCDNADVGFLLMLGVGYEMHCNLQAVRLYWWKVLKRYTYGVLVLHLIATLPLVIVATTSEIQSTGNPVWDDKRNGLFTALRLVLLMIESVGSSRC